MDTVVTGCGLRAWAGIMAGSQWDEVEKIPSESSTSRSRRRCIFRLFVARVLHLNDNLWDSGVPRFKSLSGEGPLKVLSSLRRQSINSRILQSDMKMNSLLH